MGMVLKQICLITDGCSNVGISPIEAARLAFEEGITVNVVGVIGKGEIGEYGASEIREIAQAGGGMSRIVDTIKLSQTVQMMTRKAVTQTIHQVVNEELRHILGGTSLEKLPPVQRGQVVEVVDEWSDSGDLRVALLIDASASMKPKLAAVAEAIYDLSLSLRSRRGHSEITVLTFPGERPDQITALRCDWTQDVKGIEKLFRQIRSQGTTPTGPAILEAIGKFEGTSLQAVPAGWPARQGDGLMDEYVF